jgi:hypothetical protein
MFFGGNSSGEAVEPFLNDHTRKCEPSCMWIQDSMSHLGCIGRRMGVGVGVSLSYAVDVVGS